MHRLEMWLRRFSFSRNPLRRRSDRIEAGILVGAVVMALIGIPIAIQANEAAFQATARVAAQSAAIAVPTDAVTQESTEGIPVPVRAPFPKPKVRVVWRAPDGTTREGALEVSVGKPVGTRIPVWTDRNGLLVKAPITPLDGRSRAAVVAVGVGLGWMLIVMLVFAVVRGVLERRRLVEWGAEWEQVEGKWRWHAR